MPSNLSNEAYEYLEKSPMFKLSLSSKELFHSNFLDWLSNVKPEAFQKLIEKMAGLANYTWPEVWRVKREYNNFDLCIVAYDQYKDNNDEKIDDEEDFRIMFIIENKVKSIPYKEQLSRYSQEAKLINNSYWKKRGENKLKNLRFSNKDWIGVESGVWKIKQEKTGSGKKVHWASEMSLEIPAHEDGKRTKKDYINSYAEQCAIDNPIIHILLSLATTFPGSEKIIDDEWEIESSYKWKVCNYCKYKDFILETFEKNTTGLSQQIIIDYSKFIESLTNLSKEWEKDFVENAPILSTTNDNYTMAKKIRIHDLYQKLKFSYLCTEMFKIVKEKYRKEYEVFPSNQGGLFKDKKSKKGDAFICVNYTFLHGDPLLEINIHPKYEENDVDFYYAIQVQGNAYEHGIQVKKNEETMKLLNHRPKDKFSMTVWTSLGNGKPNIIKQWMNVRNSTWNKKEWMSEPQKSDYNKYDMNDGTFVYQKYTINEGTTIATIKEQMLEDLRYIIDNLKTSRCTGES